MTSTLPKRPTATKASAGAVALLLLFSTPAHILRCWVAQHLWTWFVAPTFDTATPKVAVLYGLTWVIGLLWPFPTTPDREDIDGPYVVAKLFTIVCTSGFGLLIGAIAHAVAT